MRPHPLSPSPFRRGGARRASLVSPLPPAEGGRGGGAHGEGGGAGAVISPPSPEGGGGQGVRTQRGAGQGVRAGANVFYVAIGQGSTDREALTEARTATAEAVRQGVARLEAAHRRWWHAYYPESFLTFPDARLEAYYWIQIYKLGSAMRADGPILDLNGPWFNATPWPGIWWN